MDPDQLFALAGALSLALAVLSFWMNDRGSPA